MPTQVEIAQHLDMSQQAASAFCKSAGLDWRALTLDEIRVAYIRHIREQAAGRASADADGYDLVAERARLAHHQANIAELDELVKRRALMPVEDAHRALAAVVSMTKAKLLAVPAAAAGRCFGKTEDQIQGEVKDLIHGALRDLVDGSVDF